MKIAIDIDEVVVEHLRNFLGYYNRIHSTNHAIDEFHTYLWHQVLGIPKAQEDGIFFSAVSAGVFDLDRVEFVPGACETVRLIRAGHDCHLMTDRPPELFDNSREIGCILGLAAPLFCQETDRRVSKVELCVRHGFDVLIDDSMEAVRSVSEAGMTGILFRRPWNLGCEWDPSVSAWPQVPLLLDRSGLPISEEV